MVSVLTILDFDTQCPYLVLGVRGLSGGEPARRGFPRGGVATEGVKPRREWRGIVYPRNPSKRLRLKLEG